MWPMALKEFQQLRRDHRTLGMLVFMPVLLLVVFGFAANFDVDEVPTAVVGPGADAVVAQLPPTFTVEQRQPDGDRASAEAALRDGDVQAAVVTTGGAPLVQVDGTQLFAARAAIDALRPAAGSGSGPGEPSGLAGASVEVAFNPDLDTSTVMVPALIGLILVFVGTITTSLGVVRERQAGTLEQLAVMPLRGRDVFLGKVLPYLAVAALDVVLVVVVGLTVFGVPFVGSPATFALGAALFLFVTLGMGVLISSVSQNQGQAVQLAIMVTLPQVLLSGLIFPIASIASGIRWISYLLPLTYFIDIARGVMVRGEPLRALGLPLAMLAVLGVVVFGVGLLRFRRDLAPSARATRPAAPARQPTTTSAP